MTAPPLLAFGGGSLEGSVPLRYIYVDEAGTAANEPITVVVGIILDADPHWMAAHNRVKQILDEYVPKERRDKFVFHAKSVWGNPALREGWSQENRAQFMRAMMSVPRDLNLAVAMSMVRRDPARFEGLPDKGETLIKKGISPAQFEHVVAFSACLADADRYVRTYGRPNEVATVVAENIPQMHKFLRTAITNFVPRTFSSEHLRLTLAEQQSGKIDQNLDFRISRIVDGVHFVAKADGPLLQVADACAYGFRRYFSNQERGEEFVKSIVGDFHFVEHDWAGPMSFGLFYWHPQKR